jgi:pimeloyl-ACP methyl ester carboxylesterase
MGSHEREVIWIHALHGFLRGPEDFRPLAASLEAAFVQPPSDIDSLNWSLARDVDLDDSVRVRLVAWDLRSWLGETACSTVASLAVKFRSTLLAALAKSKGQSKSTRASERHLLLGEGLGAQVLMQAVHQERESRRKGSAQKDSKKWKAAGIPLERVVFMAAHPGLRELQEQAKRQALEAQWAERILKEPLSKIRAEWFQQPPFSTSPRMAEQPQSEADSWMELLPPARLSDLFRSLLLGHQEDEREALQGWVELLDSARFLWIAGERDRKFVQLLHELQDLGVPGEFWMCPEAGHAVFLDSPEDLAERIRQFLI